MVGGATMIIIMPSYLFRDVPDELWRPLKAQAALDGVPLRTLLLRLIRDYLKGHGWEVPRDPR
jgi:hypothetical protein